VTAPVSTVRKLGPGTLTVGAVGSPLDFSGRCTAVKVTWKEGKADDVEVLDGSTIAGERNFDATLEATVYQDDLVAGGLIDYSWVQKGTQVPFTFTPYAGGRSITGQLIVDPLDVGGDVAKKNTTDLKWACVGEPELVDDLTVSRGPAVEVEGLRTLRRDLKRAGWGCKTSRTRTRRSHRSLCVGRCRTRRGAPGRSPLSTRGTGQAGAAVVRAGRAAVPYAGPIHWGWRKHHIKAQPWLYEAAIDSQDQWTGVYLRALQQIIDTIEGAPGP
jgi:hypothetical protein